MKQRTRGSQKLLSSLIGVISFGLALNRAASAQTIYTEQTAAKLKTHIHLRLGATTLPTVLATLSKQTGLTVEAEPYLNHRKLIVQWEDVTAAAALNDLAELNGWTWRETDKDHLLVALPPPRRVASLADVPAALQATLSKDVRIYQGLGVRKEDFADATNPEQKIQIERRDSLDASGFRGIAERAGQRRGEAVRVRTDALADALRPELDKANPVYYKQLTVSQKSELQTLLLLSHLPMPTVGPSFNVYYDRLTLFQRSPMQAVLTLEQGNMLMVGATENGSYTGFGEQIHGLTPKSNQPPESLP